ncbi:MAG TPA: ATP-dependent Clp protease adaptor ClpS [Candidatus Kapabacteria bacterium]|jgi:ATP-dependent Clp protease adaptor protein ClpS|nr:ATP-dependent Clp protease adaptor ClpS [Candidatus Kapabacteria bacterium]
MLDLIHPFRMALDEIALPVHMAVLSSFDLELPETEMLIVEKEQVVLPARVILFNDDFHTFDEVIFQLMKATGCSLLDAEGLAFEVDASGQAYVFEGEMSRCLGVSSILEEIELNTEIEF